MKQSQPILMLFLCCLVSIANAVEPLSVNAQNQIRPLISLRGGVDIADVGEDTNVLLYPTLIRPNAYKVNSDTQTNGVWGAFVGVDIILDIAQLYRWQTGISYYQTQLFDVDGIVYEYMDPEAGNLGFNYSVRNQRVLFENKFLRKINNIFNFYFLVSLGANFNKASGYNEVSIEPTSLVNPYFEENTATSFSYSLGLGVDLNLAKAWSLSLGYQFSDLGKIALDTFENQVTDDHIQSSSTNTQEILLALTYFLQ